MNTKIPTYIYPFVYKCFYHTIAERNSATDQAKNVWDTPGELLYSHAALVLATDFQEHVSFGFHMDGRARISLILEMRKSNA